jgi:dihydroflavonol-4-reductase
MLRPCQGIFHLAGIVSHSRVQDVDEMFECNVIGTRKVLEAAVSSNCKRVSQRGVLFLCSYLVSLQVVYASSSGVVGCSADSHFCATDDSPYCEAVAAAWPYYRGKIEAERDAIAYAEKHGVDLMCMRPSMMWGPGDDRFRSTKLVVSFMTRHIPFIPPGGVSVVDIRDVADAFVEAMVSGAGIKTYLLTAMNCSTRELFEMLESLTGVQKPRISAPAFVAKNGAFLLDWINRRVRGKYDPSVDPVRGEMSCHWWSASSLAAQQDLNFRPRPIRQTLMDTIAFIRKHHPELRLRARL